jgi:hypothetical protein
MKRLRFTILLLAMAGMVMVGCSNQTLMQQTAPQQERVYTYDIQYKDNTAIRFDVMVIVSDRDATAATIQTRLDNAVQNTTAEMDKSEILQEPNRFRLTMESHLGKGEVGQSARLVMLHFSETRVHPIGPGDFVLN